MFHLVFFLIVLSLAIGAGAAVMLATLLSRFRQKTILWYLVIQISLGLAVFTDLFTFYLSLVLTDKQYLASVSAVIYHIVLGSIAGFLPLMTNCLLSQSNTNLRVVSAVVFPILFPSMILIHFVTNIDLFSYVNEVSILIIIAISAARLLLQRRDRSDPADPLRRIAVFTATLMLIFLPLFAFEIAFEEVLIRPTSVFMETSAFMLILYLIWSIANIIHISPLFTEEYRRKSLELSEDVMSEIGLSPREQEIALQIAAGASNKMIAGNLFISASTVKNHITRIFSKAGVNSRMELVRKLMDDSDADIDAGNI